MNDLRNLNFMYVSWLILCGHSKVYGNAWFYIIIKIVYNGYFLSIPFCVKCIVSYMRYRNLVNKRYFKRFNK
jgi:Na+/proline symporter